MNDVRQCRTVVLIIVQDFYILQKKMDFPLIKDYSVIASVNSSSRPRSL